MSEYCSSTINFNVIDWAEESEKYIVCVKAVSDIGPVKPKSIFPSELKSAALMR